jgi:Methyltransferase domain
VRRALNRIIRSLSGGATVQQLFRLYQAKRRLKPFKDPEAVFTAYYTTRHWEQGGAETVSGAGSTMEATQTLRRELPLLLTQLGVKRVLDAPCGDYNWFRLIERPPDLHYVGADIVKPLIVKNREHYANATTQFLHLDITRGPLPDADLWLCRDCFIHLSNADVGKALDNFLRSNLRYLLTTTYTDCRRNRDIPTGHFRQLNLVLPPFRLSPPSLYLDDGREGHPGKKLGLWRRERLRETPRVSP